MENIAMHAIKLLHTLLAKSGAVKHEARLNSLLKGVTSIMQGGKLSLTSIGRHMSGQAKVKNKIKSAYNLLTNGSLHHERKFIYPALAQYLLSNKKHIDIVVDWSPCVTHANQILKASIVLRGRSMTLYEEVHPEQKLGNYKVHQRFLERLKSMIPGDIQVTIMTDAGFRTEWFGLIKKLGWDFVGRVRSNMLFQEVGEKGWRSCMSEYQFATNKPVYRGEVLLSKENKLQCHMYLYKETVRSQSNDRKKKKLSKKDKAYRKSANDPWLLVTSHHPDMQVEENNADLSAKIIIKKYRKRMKIEHEFRDSKDSQWGIGLSYTRCVDPARLEILLLVGYLAIFLLWLIGLAMEYQGKHYDYQANTVKSHRVLSLVFLGTQVLFHHPQQITIPMLTQALTWGIEHE